MGSAAVEDEIFLEDDIESTGKSLGSLLKTAGYAAVDNSGSTRVGNGLRTAENFVRALGAKNVSLWNNVCRPCLPVDEVDWHSVGGSLPHKIFEPVCHVRSDCTAFLFMTDGNVWDTFRFAKHSTVNALLPSVFVIFRGGEDIPLDCRVSETALSMIMTHFEAATNATILFLGDDHTNVRLIAVKGDLAEGLHDILPPAVSHDLCLGDLPVIATERIRELKCRVYGSRLLPLDDGRILSVLALLELPDGRPVIKQLSERDIEALAQACSALHRLPQLRYALNGWLELVHVDVKQKIEGDKDSLDRNDPAPLHDMIREMQSTDDHEKRQNLLQRVQSAIHQKSLNSNASAAEANSQARTMRSLLFRAMQVVSSLDRAAESPGRHCNRAARRPRIDASKLASLSSLDTRHAPCEDCTIMYSHGPVALCLKRMTETEHNTNNYSVDYPFQVGQYKVNAVFEPTVVSLDVAERIEEMDASPLTRELVSVCLPIVSLESPENQKVVLQRLCVVFTDKIHMSRAWQLALSSMLQTIENEEWADPTTSPTGRLLHWLANQIMDHVLVRGKRITAVPESPFRDGLVSVYRTDEVMLHSSLAQASVILRLLHQFPSTTSRIPVAELRRCMLARIANAVPQLHRSWRKKNWQRSAFLDEGPTSLVALTRSIYNTTVDDKGRHHVIAGSLRLVDSLEPLLLPEDMHQVRCFAKSLALPLESLVTPGLTLVVFATLEHVTDARLKSAASVKLVKSANSAVAAEMDPFIAGSMTREDVLAFIK